ncbi:MAG: hypothetical protein ABI307_01290, partial [Mycobacterium sp.]
MDIFSAAASIARRLPMGDVPARVIELTGWVAQRTEQEFFSFLRTRLDASTPPVVPSMRQLTSASAARPRDLMADLLERSVGQDM